MKYTPEIQSVLDRQIKDSSRVRGDLVAYSTYYHVLILVFADETFAVFEIEADYDGDGDIKFDSTPPLVSGLVECGLVTKKAQTEWMKLEQQSRDEGYRQRELNELARLKTKYGKEDPTNV